MATRFKLTNKARRFMALGLSLAITASCADNDELNNSAGTHKLDFGVSLANEWHSPLKTHSANYTQQASSSHFENSDLWLTVSSEPYCDTTLFRSPKTRAATVTTNDFYDSFNVYGYAYKGADWENRSEVTPYFDNEVVTNQNGIWSTDPARYWPGNSYRMHFFAYAPSDMAATLTIENYTPVKLEYTVPIDVKEQKDFVVATADVAGNHNQSMDLLFEHILTAVKITAAKGMSGTVKKVKLLYIVNVGTYSFGEDKWTSKQNDQDDFELIFAPGQEIHLDPNAEKDTPIVDGANTFMMIPQLLPAGATLIITIADDNGDETEHTSYLYKSGITSWGKGQCVTYRISKK